MTGEAEKRCLDKGAYLLFIRLDRDSEVKVGALGTILFKKGFYVYVGSAMNSLERRISRHLKRKKTVRWHIDYLLRNRNARIIKVFEFPSEEKLECALGRKVEKKAGSSIRGFGCSDCRCGSHLYFFSQVPSCQLAR